MALKVNTKGYDPSKVTLIKLSNGAVIARSSNPQKQTLVEYDDDVMLQRIARENEKASKWR